MLSVFDVRLQNMSDAYITCVSDLFMMFVYKKRWTDNYRYLFGYIRFLHGTGSGLSMTASAVEWCFPAYRGHGCSSHYPQAIFQTLQQPLAPGVPA